MVAHSQCAVGHAASHGDRNDVGIVIANIVAELLQAPERGKVGNRVGKDNLASQGQSSRNAGHILLGHTHIQTLPGKSLGKVDDNAKAQVAHHKHDLIVLCRELG